MVEPGFEVYLGYGDDLIEYRYRSGDAAVQTLSGIMRKDGQYYQFFTEGSSAQESAVLWQATTAYEGFRAPWPMQFVWRDDKILDYQTQFYESGIVIPALRGERYRIFPNARRGNLAQLVLPR